MAETFQRSPGSSTGRNSPGSSTGRNSPGSSTGWEYRVETIGSIFGTKDENIEATLNEWGEEGWEVINVYTPEGSGKVTMVAKRPLTSRVRRQRSMP